MLDRRHSGPEARRRPGPAGRAPVAILAAAALLPASCGDPAPGQCDGVDCSGHGHCVIAGDALRCLCDPGYREVALACRVETDGEDVLPDADLPEDGGPDGDADRDGAADPGPLTFVVSELALSDERLCDLDGDGSLDNAVADLGSPNSQVLLVAFNAMLAGGVTTADRLVLHLPRVDDPVTPADPDAVLIAFDGVDTDVPENREDDFSGIETFYAGYGDLDACGEPRQVFRGTRIEAGELVSGPGLFDYFDFPIHVARFTATVARRGASIDMRFCGLALVSELGDIPGPSEFGDLTLLETFLAGGAPEGMPEIPGITPDLDLDHDGRERILLDEGFHVRACVDGDGTSIDGPWCWADPRIADAFSATGVLQGTSAQFSGRQQGWESWVTGSCTEPPAVSAWDQI